MIITRTPYRVSLFGGGTDYPEWYLKHGGEVLAGAINKYCYLTLRYLPPFFPHRYRLVYSRIESVASRTEIVHPAIRAALQYFDVAEGIELHHDGDLPARSGIGSSAAFAVGLSHALRQLMALECSPWQLARDAIHLETVLLGEVGGVQDQVICALGGVTHLLFDQDGDITAQSSLTLTSSVEDFSKWLVLLYSGAQRSSSEVSAPIRDQLLVGDPDELHRMTELVSEAKALLIAQGDDAHRQLGALMHESWLLKRSFNPRAVTRELDDIYAAARRCGALGGKVSGAGGGGFLLFCVPPDQQDAFLATMVPATVHVPFRFVDHGSQVIFRD